MPVQTSCEAFAQDAHAVLVLLARPVDPGHCVVHQLWIHIVVNLVVDLCWDEVFES